MRGPCKIPSAVCRPTDWDRNVARREGGLNQHVPPYQRIFQSYRLLLSYERRSCLAAEGRAVP